METKLKCLTLKCLTLENFKGVRQFTLEPNGSGTVVRGDNGTGKTTLMDSFLWLLFNKDSQGKADFAIKTVDERGQEVHNLCHSVEGALVIDGQEITLRKELKEKWTKKRGSAKADFTGHTTDHYIDGVPAQKKEWDARIQSIIDEDTFKLLTSPGYFNSLHWQKRREILLQVCGDISDADVIKSDILLAELPEILNGRTLGDQKKVVAAKRKEINDRLKEIPARIDELTKTLADVPTEGRAAIQGRISQLEGEIKAQSEDTEGAGLRKRKAELEAKLAEARNALEKDKREAEREIDRTVRDLEEGLNKLNRKLKDTGVELTHTATVIDQNEKSMVRLRNDYAEIKAQTFAGDTVCPACGQGLPEDQVKAAVEKYNTRKAEMLKEVNRKGKRLKEETKKLVAFRADLEKEKPGIEKQIPELEAKIKENEASKEKALKQVEESHRPSISKMEEEIRVINETLNGERDIPDTSALEERAIAERAKLAQIDGAKNTEKRIKELGEEEKTLAGEYEELERHGSLMDRFTVAKVEMLEEKINNRFALARFKLFDVQINEGIKETCETLYNGVPYSTGLNTGARVNVGIDIIRTLSFFYGVKCPIWVDHSESVTEILDPGSQTIKLVVDENYKELEVSNGS